MAKLTAEARKKIPSKDFAGPDRSYPIEDASHARNALARVSQRGSPALKSKIRAKVKNKFPAIKQAKSAPQPHPETNPGFYDSEPHAPGTKIANKPLTPMPAVGKQAPAIVPKGPGRFDGIGGKGHHFGKPPMSSHGYGHASHTRHGHMRMSGHGGAHRVGKR